MPPGQHQNKSVASTTDEFGVGMQNNSSHAPFDDWWGDEFIQLLVGKALAGIGLDDEISKEAREVTREASEASRRRRGQRRDSEWGMAVVVPPVLGPDFRPRIESLAGGSAGMRPCLQAPPFSQRKACTMSSGNWRQPSLTDSERRSHCSGKGRHREIGDALEQFLVHLRDRCNVPTAFERATPAFYLPGGEAHVEAPPSWWVTLTAEKVARN